MTEFILENEATIRTVVFVSMLLIIGAWEFLSPKRVLRESKIIRWSNNLSLVFINSLLLRLVFPAAAVGMGVFVETHGWGMFQYLSWNPVLEIVLAVVILDLVIYLQHVMVHATPLLWRLHRVHHADPDFDVTTGLRFHTIEIFVSMIIKFTAIAALGAPVIAIIIFEVLLNGMAMFNHGNIHLPFNIDKILRVLIVTPDMHRVHHSVEDHEANSNFGFNLSIWDRLFGTYRDQPELGHEAMNIGIHKFRAMKDIGWLPGLILLPFKGKVRSYVINRREWNQEDDE